MKHKTAVRTEVSDIQRALEAARTKYGSVDVMVDVLRVHPFFESIHRTTIYRWLNGRGCVRLYRPLRAIKILSGEYKDKPDVPLPAKKRYVKKLRGIYDQLTQLRVEVKLLLKDFRHTSLVKG